jgi:hypothetical protein
MDRMSDMTGMKDRKDKAGNGASHLNYDSLLIRTEQGTEKMRARTSDISPKLRSVLFLIDGQTTFRHLLDRAGSLSILLETQLRELIRLELIAAENVTGNFRSGDAVDATTPYARNHTLKAQDLPPLVAAKMQLLLRLENLPSNDIDLLGAELLEAKSLRELAETAKSVANKLSIAIGVERSQEYWQDAKKIITAWRDIATKADK